MSENEFDTLNEDGTGGICGYPYAVSSKPGVGRCLVATRDLDPGDLILKETPLVVGNLHDTPPICLACWKIVDGLYLCDECGLPMCDAKCSSDRNHRELECDFFRGKSEKKTPTIQSLKGQPHPFYECITPLRCLLLKNKDPKKWAAIQKMMDHLEDRPRDYHWDICQNNVVKYLLSKWGMEDDGFTEEEVNHVIGSLEVNAFEVSSSPGGRGRGVYPLTSLMSHSCISNARYIIHDDFHVEVRATVAIRAGEEITDHYVTPLNGTVYRRSHLKDGWFFDCSCPL